MAKEGTGTASVVKLVRWPSGTETAEKNMAGTALRAGTASEGIMFVSDEEDAALRAEVERAKKELERAKWEKKLQKRVCEAEIEWFQYEAELEGLQSDRMGIPMFPKFEWSGSNMGRIWDGVSRKLWIGKCYPRWRDRSSRRRRKWHLLQKYLRLK